MKTFEIPLNAFAEEFNVEIQGVNYLLRTKWNEPLQAWTLDIGRSENDWLIRNLALVAGENLLQQYEHLKLGFGLIVVTDGDENADPTETNLGTDSHLIVVTND